jgi:hypothetical protein
MIVYHAHCLHECITYCSPNKLETSFLQIFTHGVRLRSAGGNISRLFPRILDGSAINELPDVMVKTSKLFLYLQEHPRVSDGRANFESGSYNLRIKEQPGNVLIGFGDFPASNVDVSASRIQDGG